MVKKLQEQIGNQILGIELDRIVTGESVAPGEVASGWGGGAQELEEQVDREVNFASDGTRFF